MEMFHTADYKQMGQVTTYLQMRRQGEEGVMDNEKIMMGSVFLERLFFFFYVFLDFAIVLMRYGTTYQRRKREQD
jgi:hypothetical protein